MVGWLSLPPSLKRQVEAGNYLTLGAQYDVEILRDRWGVPHIYGNSDADTAFGLAYAHAEDDFATIQDVILATRGQLAAERGISAAKTDYLVAWMGVWEAVEAGYAALPQSTRAVAEAYADGINLYAARNPGTASRYLLPVRGEDLIAGFTFKTPMFYGFDAVLGELLSAEAPLELARDGEAALSWVPCQHLPIGSQGIAVAPARSDDGATRLLINSHQPLTGPVAWYEARLHSEEGWNVAGSTFPGAPAIIHGHNAKVGWANTVNKPDLVDIYQLELNPQNPGQYRLDGEWRDFEVREAQILVRLLGPLHWTFKRDIKLAEHGPVMETEHGSYALRWAGMGEIRTLDFLLGINKAQNRQEFEQALKMQAMPSINYVYADANGEIGHYYNAQFPNRIEGWDWNKVLPGDRSELIWEGYRTFEAMPRTVNPQTGLVYNANNPPFQATDGDDDPRLVDFPPSMGIESVVTNRALQVEALYGADARISAAEFERYKYDFRYHPDSYQMRALQGWLAAQNGVELTGEQRSAIELLRNWGGATDAGNRAAALAVLTLAPVQDENSEHVAQEKLSAAFERAVADLQQFYGRVDVPFGEVNRHVRGSFSLPLNGGPDTLRAVYGGPLNDSGRFENRAGDSYVMFVEWDAAGQVSSRAVHNFGSATLDKTSPHYADQVPLFVEEKVRPVPFQRAVLESQVSRRYRP
ncbi:acylase [Biformimicrobium ophioploci]|uniref:Acylase n=1 Tax=Biformimicrobium ophioploci TaxID=3036711 RepID=A0ABQ6M2P2_9GAMM|nr:acylase [Microbulbifer sp. NKW57]